MYRHPNDNFDREKEELINIELAEALEANRLDVVATIILMRIIKTIQSVIGTYKAIFKHKVTSPILTTSIHN